jgi:hypothetical protein
MFIINLSPCRGRIIAHETITAPMYEYHFRRVYPALGCPDRNYAVLVRVALSAVQVAVLAVEQLADTAVLAVELVSAVFVSAGILLFALLGYGTTRKWLILFRPGFRTW